MAVRAYVEDIELMPHQVEFYFHREFIPGYAWLFPLGNRRANVGLIMRVDRFKKQSAGLDDMVGAFLAGPTMTHRTTASTTVSDLSTWSINYATSRRSRRAFNGALLAGDAGSFVDALTGEGIHNALVTAVIAADVTHDALNSENFLEQLAQYDDRCQHSLGHLMRRAYNIQKWVFRFPLWVDMLFKLANANPARMQSFINRVSTDFVVGG